MARASSKHLSSPTPYTAPQYQDTIQQGGVGVSGPIPTPPGHSSSRGVDILCLKLMTSAARDKTRRPESSHVPTSSDPGFGPGSDRGSRSGRPRVGERLVDGGRVLPGPLPHRHRNLPRLQGAPWLRQQEHLKPGCGWASSTGCPFPPPQPCLGVVLLRDCPQLSGLTHLPNQATGPARGLSLDRPRGHHRCGNAVRRGPSPEEGSLSPASSSGGGGEEPAWSQK